MTQFMVKDEVKRSINQIDDSSVIQTLKKYMLVDGFDIVLNLEKSKGCYFYDSNLNEYFLDMFSFFASGPLGMNHPKLNTPENIVQLGKVAVHKPSNSDMYSREMSEFVETFFNIAVPDYFKYSFFIEGGALAVENAIKTAFDWKIKKNFKKGFSREIGSQVIHFKKAFHGRSGYTMSLTNSDKEFNIKVAYYPKFNWPRITSPVLKFPLNENNLDEVIKDEINAVNEIKEAINKNPDDIACLIIEVIQGEGGDNHFRKEFLEQLRQICDESEIILIFDEIQTGMGMTGKWWAHQYFVKPDIMVFGKKTQVCGILSTDRVDDIDNNVFHESGRINSTWGGNLIDMVRSKKILEIIQEDNLVDNARIMGGYLLEKMRDIEAKYPHLISNTRGRGLFCAMDLPDTKTRDILRQKTYLNKLIMLGSGTNSVRFRPPLIVGKKEIDEAISIVDKSLSEM
jgi:L-lysine 6-transaminase